MKLDNEHTLTHRQRAVLDYIVGFMRRNKLSPTYREIQDHFGFLSPNGVVTHVKALERKQFIARPFGNIARGFVVLAYPACPFCGAKGRCEGASVGQ